MSSSSCPECSKTPVHRKVEERLEELERALGVCRAENKIMWGLLEELGKRAGVKVKVRDLGHGKVMVAWEDGSGRLVLPG